MMVRMLGVGDLQKGEKYVFLIAPSVVWAGIIIYDLAGTQTWTISSGLLWMDLTGLELLFRMILYANGIAIYSNVCRTFPSTSE